MPLQLRRGTTAERLSIVPLPGEPIYDTELNTVFIGNGTTAGGISAISGITSEDAMDIVGQMFLNGQHEGITFTYGSTQDVANRIDARLNLANYDGEIRATAFRGSLFADDSTLLVNADTGQINPLAISGTFGGPVAASQMTAAIVTADNLFGNLTGDIKGSVFSDTSTLLVNGIDGSINLDGTVKSNVIPSANDLYDLGSNSNRFKDLYISGTIIANALVADYTGSVFADNSTVLVDAINASINLDGTVKGDVIPAGNELYDLGSNSNRFKDLYLSGSSIFLGNATITSSGTTVNLPAGSTVGGASIGGGGGDGVVSGSNYNINIVADDSSFLVNSSTNVISGNELIAINLKTQTISTEDSSELKFISPARFNTTVYSDQEIITESLQTRKIEGIGGTSIEIDSASGLILSADVISLRTTSGPGGQVNIGSTTANQDGNLYIVRNNYDSLLLKGFTFAQHHETADSVKFNFFRSRGNATSPTPVQTGDDIVDINFVGIGTSFPNPTASTIAARISVIVDGTVSSRVPGKIQFFTNNEISFAPRAELSKDGVWRANAISAFDSGIVLFETMPQLPEYADETAAGPGRGVAPQNGMMYYDTGSSQVKVYANGAWHAITP